MQLSCKIFLCLFLFSISNVKAQSVVFEKFYDFGAAETGFCVQQAPDSGFVVCGFQGLGLVSAKMLAMKTDKNGVLEWSRLFGDGSNEQTAYHIVNCSLGGYAMVGYRTGPGFVSDVYVVRLDNNGDTLWTGQYGTSIIEEGTCIQETPMGDFVISFWDENDSTGLLKIGPTGNLLWWKRYYSAGFFKHISLLSSGGYLLSGVLNTGAGLLSQGYLMRTDPLGDSLWTRHYGGTGGDEFFEAQETSDGNIVAAGIRAADLVSPYNYYLVKCDMNGDTLWTNYVASAENQECYSLHQCSDGGYALCGTSYAGGDAILYLVRTDSMGDTAWTKGYGGPDSDYGYFVKQTYDGGFIMSGSTNNWDPTGAGVYLVKTDSSGFAPTGVISLTGGNTHFSLYPNPASSFVTFETDLKNSKDVNFTLYDMLGRAVLNAEITQVRTSVSIEGLSPGVYTCRLMIDGRPETSARLMITK
jgi:hypothetical protein